MHVVVAGAGLSGLAAALALRDAGARVTLLDARDRVGGRVLTYRRQGLTAELGAEWIDAGHLTMRALCDRFALSLRPDTAQQCTLIGGVPVADTLPEDDWLRGLDRSGLGAEARQAVADLVGCLDDVARAIPDRTRPWDSPVAALDQLSVAAWLDARAAPPAAHTWVAIGVLSDFGVAPDRLSMLQLACVRETAPPERSYRIAGGNDALPRAMAEALEAEVYLGVAVTALRRDAHGVRVFAGGQRFDADAAVLAVPATAVPRILFDPPLPPDLHAACASLAYGAITKRLVPCDGRPWGAAVRWWFTDLPSQVLYEATAGQSDRSAVLTAYTAGDRAALLGHEEALADLERVFPGAGAVSAGCSVVKRWASDPWTGGAYACPAPGYLTQHGAALGLPLDRVAFAGEHLAPDSSGYMEGAAISGTIAAASILRRIAP